MPDPLASAQPTTAPEARLAAAVDDKLSLFESYGRLQSTCLQHCVRRFAADPVIAPAIASWPKDEAPGSPGLRRVEPEAVTYPQYDQRREHEHFEGDDALGE